MSDPKLSYKSTANRGEKILVKIVIRNASSKEGIRILRKLRYKYKPNSIQFWTYLNHQQIAGLKRAYGNKIAIIHGKLLHQDQYDKRPNIT